MSQNRDMGLPKMFPYYGTNSGVIAYALGRDFIDVEFLTGARYRYTHAVPGVAEVAAMKQCALAGRGLATYISQHVRERYALRLC